MLGLSVLVVENASFGGGAAKEKPIGWHGAFNTQQGQQLEAIGFAGNTVQIPGLLASDAEELKQIILKKMLENRAVETGSGL